MNRIVFGCYMYVRLPQSSKFTFLYRLFFSLARRDWCHFTIVFIFMHRMTQHQWTLSQVQQISGHTFLAFLSGVVLMSKVWKEKSILFFSWLRTNNIFQKKPFNYYFQKIIIFVYANKNIKIFFIILLWHVYVTGQNYIQVKIV